MPQVNVCPECGSLEVDVDTVEGGFLLRCDYCEAVWTQTDA